jgi:hypothetical protein
MAHTGTMIALLPTDADAQRITIDGGEEPEELHVTLMYLGEAALIPPEIRNRLIERVIDCASRLPTIIGEIFSVNLFNPAVGQTVAASSDTGKEPCVVWGVCGELLEIAHNAFYGPIRSVFSSEGVTIYPQHAPWIPHITAAYVAPDDDVDLSVFADRVGVVTFDRVRIVFGDEIHDIPLGCECEISSDTNESMVANFNPNQPRDAEGKWTDNALSGVVSDVGKKTLTKRAYNWDNLYKNRNTNKDKVVWTSERIDFDKHTMWRLVGVGNAGYAVQTKPKDSTDEWKNFGAPFDDEHVIKNWSMNTGNGILWHDPIDVADYDDALKAYELGDVGDQKTSNVSEKLPTSVESPTNVDTSTVIDTRTWDTRVETALKEQNALIAATIHNRATTQEIAGQQARDAVRDYAGTGYNAINYALRMVDGDTQSLPNKIEGIYGNKSEITSTIAGLDSAMKKSTLSDDVLLYRGISDPEEIFGEEWDDDSDMSGLTWFDGSYASTSTQSDIARRFADEGAGVAMRILAPKGISAIGIEGVEKDSKIVKPESEILLNRGLTYRVIRDHMVNGTRTLDVEVMP